MAKKPTRSNKTTMDPMAIDKTGYNPPPVAKVDRPAPSPPSPPPPRPLWPAPPGLKERT